MTAPAIIERARKLRALQQNAGTPHEAQAAARALAKLIEKHRLEEAEIGECEQFDMPKEALLHGFRVPAWKSRLGSFLCWFYGVYFYRSTALVPRARRRMRASGYFMCGTKEDVATVRHMFSWLSADLVRLSRRHSTGSRRAGDAWRRGFVDGLAHQLVAARRDAAADAPAGSTALVHLDTRRDRAADYFESKRGKLPTTRQKHEGITGPNYASGYLAGWSHHVGDRLPSKEPPNVRRLRAQEENHD